jgi:hypothetical protein
MKPSTSLVAAGACAFLAASSLSAQTVVSTAFGNGADAQVSSASASLATPTDIGSNSQQMNSRFNFTATGTSNNDIIALRFDLTGFDLTTASNVSLTLTSYRDDGARAIQLYGVTPFTTGKDNNGTIAGFDTTNWNEATVKFSTMPGLEWDTDVSASDFDLNTANTTLLGSASLPAADFNLGSTHTLGGTALATFLQTHTTTNQVTFLIRAGNTSTGQARFATKESIELTGGANPAAAGTYAPFLTFTAATAVIPEPSTYAALVGVISLATACLRRRRS